MARLAALLAYIGSLVIVLASAVVKQPAEQDSMPLEYVSSEQPLDEAEPPVRAPPSPRAMHSRDGDQVHFRAHGAGCRHVHHQNRNLKEEIVAMKQEIRMLQRQKAAADQRAVRDAAELRWLRARYSEETMGDDSMEDESEDSEVMPDNDEENLALAITPDDALNLGAAPPADSPLDGPVADAFAPSPAGPAMQHRRAGLLAHHAGSLRHGQQLEYGSETSADATMDASTDASADSSSDQQFPVVGTMSGLFNRFSSGIANMGIGNWRSADTNQVNNMQHESHEAVSTAVLQAELQRSREELGKAEEEKNHLQDRVTELEGQVGEKDAAVQQKEEALRQVQDEEQAEAAKLQSQAASELGNQTAQLEQKLAQEKANEADERKFLEAKIAAKDEEVDHEEAERKKLVGELHQELNGEGKFAAERFEVERKHQEDSLRSESTELQKLQGSEKRCMQWGQKLEAKLQRVLANRKNDAKLCRDGILSLHDERSKLREERRKIQKALKAAEQGQAEAERSSTEDRDLLSKCLDEQAR